jgi:pyruvate/2-oxoglutarate dehydrogenase complex dihydrolipoamide acyltransferase (E2) component
MRQHLKLARAGMNMEEATIARWHKQPGETFRAGEVLYEIETEKVTQAVEAASAGRLLEICVAEGEDAAVGERLCLVEVDGPGPAPSAPGGTGLDGPPAGGAAPAAGAAP